MMLRWSVRPADFWQGRSLFQCLLLIGAVLLVMTMTVQSAISADMSLAWDPNKETNITGYKVYYGTASRSYTSGLNVGKVTNSTLTGLGNGQTYYFSVTAVNSSGFESTYSNEVTYTTPPCAFSISPTSQSFTAAGGSGSINVTSQTGCAWATTNGASWFTISSGSTGTGNGTINYTVAANNSAASRTAAVTIAGKIFTVTQAGVSTYMITAQAGAGGTISPSGNVSVSNGGNATFTITPNSGYSISDVNVDGTSVGQVSSYTFRNITANHTIAATFSNQVSIITASAGAGGVISPSGSVSVISGTSQTFNVTPNSGYVISDLKVDGTSVGALGSYTFQKVTATHTIQAIFAAASNVSYSVISPVTLVSADSQELVGENGAAQNALDGLTNTIWHTQWYQTAAPMPHQIVLDLGRFCTINGFKYLPRQDGGINGTVANYAFYISDDGSTWGQAVATGTFANNNQLKQVVFAAKTGRFIKFVALSEVNGKAYTSMAELSILGTPLVYNAVPQALMKIVSTDSEETVGENGATSNAIDGLTSTAWHSKWYGGNAPLPHEIVIDLGASYTVGALVYLPRQDGGVNGIIADYAFYVSSDTVNWGQPVVSGKFAADSLEKKVFFPGKYGRYIRLVAISEINGNPWTSAAEIKALVLGN